MSTTLDHTIDGIPCKELLGSGGGVFTINDSSATRIFRCNWSERFELAQALLGSVSISQSGTTVVTPPKQHPKVPALYAQEVKIDPYDPNNSKVTNALPSGTDANAQEISYDFAKLTVSYRPYAAEFGPGDQIITEEFDVSAETLEVEGSAYVLYTATNTPYSKTFFKNIGQVEDQIVFHRSASNKLSSIKSLVGKVNSATVAGTKRGSMMFLGGRGRRSILTTGVEQWELAYKFRSRTTDDSSDENEWQKVFIAGTGWVRLLRKDDTTKGPYEYGDFSALFS